MIESSKGSLAMTIGSILLALLAARAGGSSGGDAAMGVMLGTQAAMLSKQLGYSRDAEREADRFGLWAWKRSLNDCSKTIAGTKTPAQRTSQPTR